MSRQPSYINPLFQYGQNELYEEDLDQGYDEDEGLINQIFSSFQNESEYDNLVDDIQNQEDNIIFDENGNQYDDESLQNIQDLLSNNSYEQEFYEDIERAENDINYTFGFIPGIRMGEMEGVSDFMPLYNNDIDELQYNENLYDNYYEYSDEEL